MELVKPENAEYWSCDKPIVNEKVPRMTKCKIVCLPGFDNVQGKNDFLNRLSPYFFTGQSKGHNDSKPQKKYFCLCTHLRVSFWVNKSRGIVFFKKFDLKSVWV